MTARASIPAAMAKQAIAHTELEPIDRLEDKIKLLVNMVARLREDQAEAAAANARLMREIEELRERLSEADGVSAELSALRSERDVVRSRVSEMLAQLESI